MNREEAKATVKNYLRQYLEGKGINIRENFRCLNPDHNDKTPSMTYYDDTKTCYCHGCKAQYDIFDLIGIDYGLTDNKEIFRQAYSMYGIKVNSQDDFSLPAGKIQKPTKEPIKEPIKENYQQFLHDSVARFNSPAGESAVAWMKDRGISRETAERLKIGYVENFKLSKRGGGKIERSCIVCPVSNQHFIVRNMNSEDAERYEKRGRAELYKRGALETSDKPIFIVEGFLDALSIYEVGGVAVAIGSTSGTGLLLDYCKKKKPSQTIIIALDNDDAGRKAAEELSEGLKALGVSFCRLNPYGDHKDANEALIADREIFAAKIRKAEETPAEDAMKEEREQYYVEHSAAGFMTEFEDGVTASITTEAISTGFYNLDEALDGGFYEGLYCLGAVSSLGKTTFCLQIADNIAKTGQDVLYFALEQSKKELIAKSISRITFEIAGDCNAKSKTKLAKTVRGILSGARYANYISKEKELIEEAKENYKSYANNLFFYEGLGDISVIKVSDIVKEHIKITGHVPVIIIDYMQILAPTDVRQTDKQKMDQAVVALKVLSRDYRTPVIGISSFNRESYKGDYGGYQNGEASLASFKESGAIEYSADVAIALEFGAAGNIDFSEKKEKKKCPREIRARILKNRNGEVEATPMFLYRPDFNYYEEA